MRLVTNFFCFIRLGGDAIVFVLSKLFKGVLRDSGFRTKSVLIRSKLCLLRHSIKAEFRALNVFSHYASALFHVLPTVNKGCHLTRKLIL